MLLQCNHPAKQRMQHPALGSRSIWLCISKKRQQGPQCIPKLKLKQKDRLTNWSTKLQNDEFKVGDMMKLRIPLKLQGHISSCTNNDNNSSSKKSSGRGKSNWKYSSTITYYQQHRRTPLGFRSLIWRTSCHWQKISRISSCSQKMLAFPSNNSLFWLPQP